MNVEEIINYCITLPGTLRAETKDGKWTVFTKDENVYLLIRKNSILKFITVSLPETERRELIDEYNIVSPSVLGMRGWFDIDIDHNFLVEEIMSLIRRSYDMVCNAQREAEKEKYLSLSKMLGI